ncbi:MAG: hypothetical protein KGM24_06025 [Elusimicrobia bacterium]|nr:hypothetical protein [Elusimicrobiota bacterium]
MLRRWLARRVTPLIWKLSPRREAAAMREYGIIEKDSGCQILDALDLVAEPAARAQLFQQVLEEFHHADLFEGACRELSSAPVPTPIVTRDALVGENPGPSALLDLIAYVHVGEAAVDLDFQAYATAPLKAPIARAFALARADEHHHVADSRRMLEPFAAGRSLSRVLWKARLLRGWRAYLKAMRGVGQVPLGALLSVLYVLAAPLRGASRRRLEMPPERQLEILREQWARAGAR